MSAYFSADWFTMWHHCACGNTIDSIVGKFQLLRTVYIAFCMVHYRSITAIESEEVVASPQMNFKFLTFRTKE